MSLFPESCSWSTFFYFFLAWIDINYWQSIVKCNLFGYFLQIHFWWKSLFWLPLIRIEQYNWPFGSIRPVARNLRPSSSTLDFEKIDGAAFQRRKLLFKFFDVHILHLKWWSNSALNIGLNGAYCFIHIVLLNLLFQLEDYKVIGSVESFSLLVKCIIELLLIKVAVPNTEVSKQFWNINFFNSDGCEVFLNLVSTNPVKYLFVNGH